MVTIITTKLVINNIEPRFLTNSILLRMLKPVYVNTYINGVEVVGRNRWRNLKV